MTTTIERSTDKTSKLQVSRVIRASRQRAFDAWTRPEYIRQWFGPADKTVSNAETDPREGGAYRIGMRSTLGAGEKSDCEIDMSRDAVAEGRYLKVVPHELLSFTWKGNWTAGEETLVTVTFKDVAGGTEVTVMHERFESEASRSGHETGWTGSLEKLARFAEAD